VDPGWSNGATAGQAVLHLHVHLLPRYEPQLISLNRDHHTQAQLPETRRKLVGGNNREAGHRDR
jgi:diadenosine tetraphosphate (Ap4A) HIT family hydrolase